MGCSIILHKPSSLHLHPKGFIHPEGLIHPMAYPERERESRGEHTQSVRVFGEMAMAGTMASPALLPSYEGFRAHKPTSKISSSTPTTSSTSCQPLSVVADKRVQKRRQIVLTADVQDLGKTGELLAVKTGYFRNYLYPFGKAKIATSELLKSIKLEEARKEEEKRAIKAEAESVAKMFQTIGGFSVRRKKGGQGKQIFGTVTTQDIVDIIKANTQRDIDKRIVTLPEIREVGQYIAEIKLHPEVTAQVKINVIGK